MPIDFDDPHSHRTSCTRSLHESMIRPSQAHKLCAGQYRFQPCNTLVVITDTRVSRNLYGRVSRNGFARVVPSDASKTRGLDPSMPGAIEKWKKFQVSWLFDDRKFVLSFFNKSYLFIRNNVITIVNN